MFGFLPVFVSVVHVLMQRAIGSDVLHLPRANGYRATDARLFLDEF
jgi:hypothetical protein